MTYSLSHATLLRRSSDQLFQPVKKQRMVRQNHVTTLLYSFGDHGFRHVNRQQYRVYLPAQVTNLQPRIIPRLLLSPRCYRFYDINDFL